MFSQEGVTDKPLGSPIPVLFNPADPSDARIESWFFVWGVLAVKCVLGIGLFLVGMAQWMYLRRTVATTPSARGLHGTMSQ
ncbi:DUF3592 domain-containing protein [Nordella sp. HKS 07]|uniref:DUF3592 domain-containing protein n=1 Tax=Nordella sp. HKS 07 TaxID=2712222 RepID=UPI00352C039E